ncbi:site-specific integrase [Cupriavidus basilensis]|uniref:Site-specific integrase n=1 Tax=Cupriavidus basilensis TaxID=68895 RepID=A0ABT6AR85_9BURK|nr:site-specific integrase [Cupriavidus basilensis]MDF3835144.1 site-specific integrase [Cupriavidus basilensis]
MDRSDRLWLTNPTLAYADWQAREAAGADRRPFSARSIVQHEAMFERFRRHLLVAGVTLATFGSDHIDAFWQAPEANGYTAATRMRYLKLLDRLCRHLVAIGVRQGNPAEQLVRDGQWPQDDPLPIFLLEDADGQLQAHVQPHAGDDLPTLRSRAIVAFFLGTGITVAEGRSAQVADLQPAAAPPYLHVPAHGTRDARTVHLDAFAVPILSAWLVRRATLPIASDLLFSLKAGGTPITEMSLGKIVRAALETIAFEADDMSPRILRNTFCRRQLLAGRSSEDVSKLMGLASSRTCDRIAATIE